MKKNNLLNFEKLPNWINPEDIFQKLFADSKHSFWLDSNLYTKNYSRFSYMGSSSEIVMYSITTKQLTVEKNGDMQNIKQDVFSYLKNQLENNFYQDNKLPFDFVGGYIGYFGYELKTLCGSYTSRRSNYPDSLWFFVEQFLVFDHKEKNIYLVSCSTEEKKYKNWFGEIKSKLQKIEAFKTPPRNKLEIDKIKFTLDRNFQQYITDIASCKNKLLEGNSYQICLTNSLSTKLDIDPLNLYIMLRKSNPAPYSAYLNHNNLSILCSSPEQFLTIDKKRNVSSKPIKGTIKRGRTLLKDTTLKNQLLKNEKEKAENLMIVDLVRNDLGKVCKIGSVKVSKLMEIESYQTVHQLVSTINGKLRNNISSIDCIRACFPGGSMTGAPKTRTMEIIDTLEQKARGIYSGSLGFLSLNDTASLNIVIRSIIAKKTMISIGTGGAILMQSDPEKEYDEMILKATILMQTISDVVGVDKYEIIGDKKIPRIYNKKMHKIFLSLGSNVGDKNQFIKKSIQLLGKKVKNIKTAPLQETKPMYYEDQAVFKNTVLLGYTYLSPKELLKYIKRIEKKIGRKERFRNGPREIDIDILFFDNLVYKDKDLEIPHPRIQERDFVLKPFIDIDPDFVHPILQKTIKELRSLL